jgi:hypothetical protein
MKHVFLAATLLLAPAAVSTVSASPAAEPSTPRVQPPLTRVARDDSDDDHGWRRRHSHHEEDDDDEDEGPRHQGRRHHDDDHDRDGGRAGDRPADPNAANAPVPNNGVFSGARPKVEVK